MRGEIVHVVESSVRDPGRVEPMHDLLDRHRRERSLDHPRELGAIGDASRVVDEALVARQLRRTKHVGAETRPLAIVLNSEEYVAAVAGAVRSVRRDRRMRGARARRRRPGILREVHRLAHPLAERVEHRYVDTRAASGLRALEERHEGS